MHFIACILQIRTRYRFDPFTSPGVFRKLLDRKLTKPKGKGTKRARESAAREKEQQPKGKGKKRARESPPQGSSTESAENLSDAEEENRRLKRLLAEKLLEKENERLKRQIAQLEEEEKQLEKEKEQE